MSLNITPQNTIITFDIHGVLLNQIEKKMHSLHGATKKHSQNIAFTLDKTYLMRNSETKQK